MTDSDSEDEQYMPPRLSQLAPNLWLDLTLIESVRTFTKPSGDYWRRVEIKTRTGASYTLAVPGTGSGSQLVSEADRLLAEWLDLHLGDVIDR